jgi:hypothetical protein
MFPDIPKSLAELAKAITPKPVADFSELISLKLFGKSLARLKAEAESEGEAVKQQGEIQREVQRPFIVEIETAKAYRQYSNLGSTLQKATVHIRAPKKVMRDDNDVFWGLLEHAKEISNEEMQNLIAKIIAGEYNNPDTYSMCTLQILKSLGKKEIELFEKVCSLLLPGNMLPHALFTKKEVEKDFMKSLGIHFGSLQTLQGLGLFLPNEMTNMAPNPEKIKYKVVYMGEKLTFECENENTDLQIPDYYGLSEAGEQILQHLNPKKIDGYIDWLKNNYTIPNYRRID